MRTGDVVRMRNWENVFRVEDRAGTMKYKAPKGTVAVFIFLGHEPAASDSGRIKAAEGQPLDPSATMESIGWVRPSKMEQQ